MKEVNKNIAKNIKNYMEALDITQVELARRLNCANTSVSMWTQGEATPRMDKIDKMCEIFHCTRQDLISENPKSRIEIEKDRTRAMFIEKYDQMSDELKLRLITYMDWLTKLGEDDQ